MTLSGAERARLDGLLHRLALGEAGEGADYDHAMARAADLLDADADASVGRTVELRLRLAMHLAPPEAIDYTSIDPSPRHSLVRRHLIDELGVPTEVASALSRAVAQVLRDAQEGRGDVLAWRDRLIAGQGGRCAHCHFRFGTPLTQIQADDEYKPYAVDPDMYCAPHVDHVDAVSALGSNDPANLQALCALCNRGKGSGLGFSVLTEHKHAAAPIDSVPPVARATMLFYVIARANRRCAVCTTGDTELTIRPLHSTGAYVRSNLRSVCRACAA